MSLKFGEIDAGQILENEYRVEVLEQVIDWLLQNTTTKTSLTSSQIYDFRKKAIERLQKKYPKSGIELGERQPS